MYNIMKLPRPSGTEVSNLQAVGPQQGIYVPPAENGVTPAVPGWIEYPTGCFEAIQKTIQDLIDDMFRQAGQQGVSAQVKSGAGAKQSGISKSYDFHAQSFVLKESAKMAKDCEMEIARIFQLYVDEKFDFEVHYEEDFDIEQNPSDDVLLYGDYIALNPGPKAKGLAMKMLAHSVFDDADPDDLAEVIAEADEQIVNAEKDARDIPPEGVPGETPEEKAAREAEQAKQQAAPLPDAEPAKKKDVKKIAKRGYSLKKKAGVE